MRSVQGVYGVTLPMLHTSSRQSRGKRRLSIALEASSRTGRATRGFSNHALCRLLVPGCAICSSMQRGHA